MRHLLLFGLLCLALPTTAAADPAPDDTPAAYCYAGKVDASTGAWLTQTLVGMPDRAAVAHHVDVQPKQGLKLHAMPSDSASPFTGPVVGRLKAGAHVKVVRFVVLGAAPGEPRAVWAEVAAPPRPNG